MLNANKARTRKIKNSLANLSKDHKAKIDQKRFDDMESDVLEGFISSNESLSEFEEDDDDRKDDDDKGNKKNKNKKGQGNQKKIKKAKKDKRTTLSKSKVNLKQMISEMERKLQTQPQTRGINYLSIGMSNPLDSTANASQPRPVPPIRLCSVCLLPGRYSCPRCWDRYCGQQCLRHHKEYVCAHLEYNYYF
jgi:hypothetical protein